MLFAKFWRGQCRVFSRDILKGGNVGVRAGGRGVLGVYYLLENIIHYYYCQCEGGARGEDSSQGGEDSPPSPPLENTKCTLLQDLTLPVGSSPCQPAPVCLWPPPCEPACDHCGSSPEGNAHTYNNMYNYTYIIISTKNTRQNLLDYPHTLSSRSYISSPMCGSDGHFSRRKYTHTSKRIVTRGVPSPQRVQQYSHIYTTAILHTALDLSVLMAHYYVQSLHKRA